MTAVQELVDAKIAAAEARTDVKFGQLIGEMQLMNQRLGHIEAEQQALRTTLRTNIWTATSIVIGSMIGILALMATILPWAFDAGGAIHELVAHEIAFQKARDRLAPP